MNVKSNILSVFFKFFTFTKSLDVKLIFFWEGIKLKGSEELEQK